MLTFSRRTRGTEHGTREYGSSSYLGKNDGIQVSVFCAIALLLLFNVKLNLLTASCCPTSRSGYDGTFLFVSEASATIAFCRTERTPRCIQCAASRSARMCTRRYVVEPTGKLLCTVHKWSVVYKRRTMFIQVLPILWMQRQSRRADIAARSRPTLSSIAVSFAFTT